jgi:hypothetical protein
VHGSTGSLSFVPAAATSSGARASAQASGDEDREARPRAPLLLILGVFLVSRAAAYAAGLRFDDRLLHGAYQLLDVRLLRDNPVTSIYYLRSQPPLFNVFTALVVRLPARLVNTTLLLAWHAAALTTALLTFGTMRRVGVRAWLAAGLVSFYLLLPETLLIESWFFYSQLVMLLVALMLWGLARFASTRATVDGVLFTGALGALVLLRSSFHIVLMVVLIAIVWRQLHLSARRVAVIATIPVLIVAAWSMKNLIVFDSSSNSSWLGMNLSYVAHAGVTRRDCQRLRADQRLSAIACETAFGKPPAYLSQFPKTKHYGAAATDSLYKSTGEPNYNAGLYAAVSRQYQHDSLELLRHGGISAIARAEGAAYTVWAEPGDDSLQLRRARSAIAGYADWFDRLVLLRPVATGWNNPARFAADAGQFPIGDALGSISYTLVLGFGLALFGGVAGWRQGRRGQPALQCVCVAGLVVMVVSTVVGNALDYRENNRFRVETSPVVLVLASVGVEELWRRTRSRARAEEQYCDRPRA